ncbi:MAG: hypothetical protein ACTSU7_11240 [Candidatus Heimdallarchaeaceae archaeon]
MNYRLKIDGDAMERKAWDLFIRSYFPNYEQFWLKFVVPRTNRPKDIRTKKDTPLDERIIIMLHYSILTNLLHAFEDLPNSYNRKIFENIYIRLSSATDVCEDFLFRFFLWIEKRQIEDITEEYKGFDKEIKPKKKEAIKVLEKGKNYSIPFLSKRDIIKKLTFNDFGSNLFEFIDLMRTYRNFVIHSWQIFQIDNLFPKKEYVQEYRDWFAVLEELEDNKKRG